MSHDPRGLPCPNPNCESSDGYKIDPKTGWRHCFVCDHNVPPKEAHVEQQHVHKAASPLKKALPDFFPAIPERGLSADTCKKYGIWKEGENYFFPCYEGNKLVGMKA